MEALDIIIRHRDLDAAGNVQITLDRDIHARTAVLEEATFIPATDFATTGTPTTNEETFLPDVSDNTHLLYLGFDWIVSPIRNISGTTTSNGAIVVPMGHFVRRRTSAEVDSAVDTLVAPVLHVYHPNREYKVAGEYIPQTFNLRVLDAGFNTYQPLDSAGAAPGTNTRDWTLLLKFNVQTLVTF